MKTYGVIMAGGGGTRFWPLSRKDTPKQLLNLSGKNVMVCETADRLFKVANAENVYVITAASQAQKIKDVLRGRLLLNNVLSEPCAKNTSAAIGYAAVRILKERGDGVLIVSPSDAYIKDAEEYARVLALAAKTAENEDTIVTIGIVPSFPATGYGYIKANGKDNVRRVERFVEKPDVIKAKAFISDGGYFWNSGVFVFKASVILKEIQKFLPNIYENLQRISSALGTEAEEEIINKAYSLMESVSIDYGVMEKTENISVAVGDFGWNDVGSWDMLGAVKGQDENGNITVGKTVNIDTVNSVIYSTGRTVATIGLSDIVVVETADAVLVCQKSRAQEVKKIVDELNEKGIKDLL